MQKSVINEGSDTQKREKGVIKITPFSQSEKCFYTFAKADALNLIETSYFFTVSAAAFCVVSGFSTTFTLVVSVVAAGLFPLPQEARTISPATKDNTNNFFIVNNLLTLQK
jgi:predicted phage tail protein